MQDIAKRGQAVRRIQTTDALSQIQELEPTALEHVVELALMYEGHENHWHAYEQLKRQVSKFVGWDAPKKELQTPGHYLTMLDFIEWLLPASQEQMEVLALDEPLYDEEEEPVFVPRRATRQIAGFYTLGEIIEGTLGYKPRQVDGPEEA